MNKLTDSVVSVLVAVVGLAIVAVLVSESSKTSSVVQTSGQAFAGIIHAAVGPVQSGYGI